MKSKVMKKRNNLPVKIKKIKAKKKNSVPGSLHIFHLIPEYFYRVKLINYIPIFYQCMTRQHSHIYLTIYINAIAELVKKKADTVKMSTIKNEN